MGAVMVIVLSMCIFVDRIPMCAQTVGKELDEKGLRQGDERGWPGALIGGLQLY